MKTSNIRKAIVCSLFLWGIIVSGSSIAIEAKTSSLTTPGPGGIVETPPSQLPATVTLNLTNDLVMFFKSAVWVGGIFIAILAFIGVAFFGFDVRKARASIQESLIEIRNLRAEAKSFHAEIKEARQSVVDSEERIKEMGATVEELSDTDKGALPIQRQPNELIREIIDSSKFEWTTIARLIKKTGLDRDKILDLTRAMPEIEIGFGRKTGDNIFRVKKS